MTTFRFALLTLTLVLAVQPAAALPATPGYQMKSYFYSPIAPTGWHPAAAWCDAGNRVLALTESPFNRRDVAAVRLYQWTGTKVIRQSYQYGPSEGGAGNLYTALTPAGQPVRDRHTSYVHTSNVENTNDTAYRMDHIIKFVLPTGTYTCTYQAQAEFMGATARHGITVLGTGSTVRYVSSNRDGSAGLNLAGGTHTVSPGSDDYFWKNNGYSYALHVGRPGATLTVRRGSAVMSREAFQAYSVSLKK